MKAKKNIKMMCIIVGILLFIGIGACGVAWYYFNGVRVNGKSVAFVPETVIEQEIAKTWPTTVTFRGASVDVSSCVITEVPDVEKKFGDQEIKKSVTIDHDKMKEKILSSESFKEKLTEFEHIDYELCKDYLEPEKTCDISMCTALDYDQDFINKYHDCQAFSVTYENGMKTKDMSKYVSIEDGKLVFDDSYLEKFIHKLEKKYDTVGRSVKLKLFSDKKRTRKISGSQSTWGTLMDSEKELAFLKKAFHKGKSYENRNPVMKSEHGGEVGKTRIEISISRQTAWYYKKGKLIKKTSVVTGKSGHDTPKGVFYISERVPGKYLVGSDYKTWVNRWMRLTNRGVGLHDANWRGRFGGSIYRYSGSHGCVNLPSSFAYWLYPKTYVGMPVIIY